MPHTSRFGSATLNQEHFDSPQLGDGWQEQFCYHFIVVDVLNNGNIVIVPVHREGQGQVAQYDKAYEITKTQFHDEVYYRHGFMRNTFLLDVVPGHREIAAAWKEQYQGQYLAVTQPVANPVVVCGFRGVGKSQVTNLCHGEKKALDVSTGGDIDYYVQLVTKPPAGLDILLLPADPIVMAALTHSGVRYHMVYPHASLCSAYLHRIHRRGATAADVHRFKAGWVDAVHDCHYQPGCVHWQLHDKQYLVDVLPKIIHMEHLDDHVWDALEKKVLRLVKPVELEKPTLTATV
ncbi:hypothetical protein FDI21_gp251 [Pseudomonas phage Noxifer]|uniref:Uncharacterized protein n=1 Tax=Pseudomonas phage Noxifer TaxID=2006684 RepID=A0A1Y0SVK9_9CAUD|nr:hypothetical protein FDI21_gp251 [Pseudomonas phage Noxifer]ARV77460.1 hypothetical protein NOXIFER_295 [Pseudomonas phage Noxifer]